MPSCLHPLPMWRRYKKDNGKWQLSSKLPPSRLSNPAPDVFVPCGKCLACRLNRRNEWVRRLQVETWTNPDCGFATLTYRDEDLPKDYMPCKHDVQCFIKRLRNVTRDYGINIGNLKYFIVSEFGSRRGRPHYHGVIYGIDFNLPCWRSHYICNKGKYPIYTSDLLSEIWRKGYVTIDSVTSSSLHYVAKYLTKSEKQDGLFCLYSRGIGKDFFVRDNSLTSNCLAAYDNGYVVYRAADNCFKGPLPKFVDRYAEKLAPDFFASVKARRREFVCNHFSPLLPSERERFIKSQMARENQKERALDNAE